MEHTIPVPLSKRYSPHINTDEGGFDVKGTNSEELGLLTGGLLTPVILATRSLRDKAHLE